MDSIKTLILVVLRYYLKKSIKGKSIKAPIAPIAPIIVSSDGIVVDGNHRVIIARELGIEIPVIRLNNEIKLENPNYLKTYYD